MNEKDITKLAALLSDESKIVFADGIVVAGAKQVTEVMLGAAQAYHQGYMIGRRRLTVKVIAGSLLIYGAVKLYVMVKNNPKWLD